MHKNKVISKQNDGSIRCKIYLVVPLCPKVINTQRCFLDWSCYCCGVNPRSMAVLLFDITDADIFSSAYDFSINHFFHHNPCPLSFDWFRCKINNKKRSSRYNSNELGNIKTCV